MTEPTSILTIEETTQNPTLQRWACLRGMSVTCQQSQVVALRCLSARLTYAGLAPAPSLGGNMQIP